jgi:hypothetical protein
MFGDFLAQGLELRDRLSELFQPLDLFAKPLVIVTTSEEIEVTPLPRIEQVSIEPEAIEGISEFRGVVKKYDVSGVSKRYSRELINQEGVTFLVEGKACHLVPGTVKEGSISWAFQLQEVMIEQEDFYV